MVRVFYELLERIGFEPFSLFRTHRLGGVQYYGWTGEQEVLASVVEEMRSNTLTVAAVGGAKRLPKKIELYQGRPQEQAAKPRTLKEAIQRLRSL